LRLYGPFRILLSMVRVYVLGAAAAFPIFCVGPAGQLTFQIENETSDVNEYRLSN
jgi:hypothetical protein